ncbi:MAG TPA: hypothetical protein PK323_03600 [Bacteroidia bacterium]|nr:hypothetical protein [Bacteroidia bacterium]
MHKHKGFYTLITIFLFKVSFAQMPPEMANEPVLLSKKGEVILPEAKDWALSVDASPFLTYTGKLLSTTGSDAPNVNSLANYPLTIGGKYFMSAKQAYRARVRIGIASQSVNNAVVDNQNTTLDTVYIKDTKKTSATNITLAFGKEFRKGKTRLQGFYGGEGIIGVSTSKALYTYGNAFSNLNVSPTSTDFLTPTATGFANAPSNTRIQSESSGTGIKVAARAFVGAEYFIFPKMSIGVEFGFSLMYYNQNDGKLSTESWDAASGGVKNKTLAKSGSKGFGIDNDNSGGAIMLNFHF